MTYLLIVLPNVFLPLRTAYNILRHNGVEIGAGLLSKFPTT